MKAQARLQKSVYFFIAMAAIVGFQNCGGSSSSLNSSSSNTAKPTTAAAASTTRTPASGSTTSFGGGGFGGATTGGAAASDGFAQDLSDVTVDLKASLYDTSSRGQAYLSVSLSSTSLGTGGWDYKWFKDGKELSANSNYKYMFLGNQLMVNAYDYSIEGNYYVQATDGNGKRYTSRTATLKVDEGEGPCSAGSYFSANQDPMYTQSGFESRFSNTRGRWLISPNFVSSNDLFGVTYSTTSMPAANSRQTVAVSCTNNRIFNINEDQYQNGWAGSITFECRNQRYLYVSRSCTYTQPVNPNNGYVGGAGSGGGS